MLPRGNFFVFDSVEDMANLTVHFGDSRFQRLEDFYVAGDFRREMEMVKSEPMWAPKVWRKMTVV